ncbi:uncharacterized protein LOC127079212 [Lathyrus oleraceus]|nr:uncharacterized protein LOC127079212 [Pisum sativum]
MSSQIVLPSFIHFSCQTPQNTLLFKHKHRSTQFSTCKISPLSSSFSSMATNLNASQLDSSSSLSIGQTDLLIVGPGVLGRLVAHQWRQEYKGCQVFGQTITTDHHEELIQLGISPSLNWTKFQHKFPYVIFCAPPYQSSDYHGDLKQAASCWNGEGSFLYTSSSAPYDCNDNGLCDEDTPVVPIGRSLRTDVLLNAESIVLEFGGSVVRLSGLYKEGKGAHAYYLEKGIVESRPDHVLNLIHYEDAASLSVAILKKHFRGKIFLGCDNHPLSRQELMDLVEKSGKFSKKFEKFTGTNDPLGKRLNNSKTRQEVGWEPKYSSFGHFLETL